MWHGPVSGMFTESACLHICLPFDCSFLPEREGWMTDSGRDSGTVEVDHQLSVRRSLFRFSRRTGRRSGL
ncbi:unnamed protein product [Larinioides sclopetarius]|uniref:Uncharacterized protein n=1 Tax=Larinioides sclopetarius TaxID=280406 RepID=A0AAV2B2X6_9ARAC